MAKSHDVLPRPDAEFDILQTGLVKAVTDQASAWGIPTEEITKLTDAQTPWNEIWAIARNKYNKTSTQKIAKDIARINFEKVLRPFIQRWIYRNEKMRSADVVLCGLKPHEGLHTRVHKLGQADGVTAKRGEQREIITECPLIEGAKYYGCILTEGSPLPNNFSITEDGEFIFSGTGLRINLTEQRVKHFKGLKHNVTYYVYYYLVNAAGVSPLSSAVSILCL